MPEAVVVGAGIGGVAAAVALKRCGWRVTVLERAPELGEVGAGLSIWPSAAVALRQLGVTGIEPGVLPPGASGLRTEHGRWMIRGAAFGAQVPLMIHRARLHDRITDQFGPGVTVRTGYTVTGVDQDGSGATVSGTGEQLRADLVVGADGLRSAVRSALHPDYPGPQYSGYTSYRGLVEFDTADGGGETWGSGRRFGFARLEDGRIYWYATANQPAHESGDLADVRTAFATWHAPIPQILAAATQVLQTDIHDLALPLVPFVAGRVVLLGDAAHAMTPNLGRGACSAIEDAAALAKHLGSPNDLSSALSAYDLERRPATTKLVRTSRRVGQIGQLENGILRGARDNLAALGGKLASLRATLRPTHR
jgi:2-polyprenyl-6-methoxyphenol hydroxylase-like FAD-dependent oxidoreductase